MSSSAKKKRNSKPAIRKNMSQLPGGGAVKLKAKDFASDQDVRWCPGCGDYSILKQVQSVLADLGANKDETVFISGIGLSLIHI